MAYPPGSYDVLTEQTFVTRIYPSFIRL